MDAVGRSHIFTTPHRNVYLSGEQKVRACEVSYKYWLLYQYSRKRAQVAVFYAKPGSQW